MSPGAIRAGRAFILVLTLLCIIALIVQGRADIGSSIDTPVQVTPNDRHHSTFPPEPLVTTEINADDFILRLSNQPAIEFDPVYSRYKTTPDLYGFMMDILPLATAGDGSAQYHLYLTLEECRAYLGPNGQATLSETTLKPYWRKAGTVNEIVPDRERELWLHEYQRCKNFVGASLLSVEAALGGDIPGAVIEYGSVWFERAFVEGFPPALVDMLSRSSDHDPVVRQLLKRMAVLSGDPRVYLHFFEHEWESSALENAETDAIAWLLLACRSGLDCGVQPYWFATGACAAISLADCNSREPVVQHFWNQLSDEQKHSAFHRMQAIEKQIADGHMDWLN